MGKPGQNIPQKISACLEYFRRHSVFKIDTLERNDCCEDNGQGGVKGN